MGLLRMEESPSKVTGWLPSAASALKILSVVPEFATSMKLATGLMLPPVPSMVQQLSSSFTLAPNSVAALNAARVSADSRGFLRNDLPPAIVAIATALMVCDFDAGIKISPLRVDFRDSSFNFIIFTGSKNKPMQEYYKIASVSISGFINY